MERRREGEKGVSTYLRSGAVSCFFSIFARSIKQST
jgi:hypothetical protein